MPAVSNPPIARQRLILAALLVLIGVLVWWQDAGGDSSYPTQKFSKSPVAAIVAQTDFTAAEAAWSGLQIDHHGNLQIDALTDTALSEAVALIQRESSEPLLERMAFLLEKQFGATASQQVMQLLPVLKNYKEAERRWWTEHGSRDPPPHEELFELQDEVFGKTLAAAMFSEQRRLAHMMLASHRVRNDATLTQAQKDHALMELQKSFQQSGAPIE